MLSTCDISRSIRNDLFARSMRPVWLQGFDERAEAIEHPEKVWREQPVDILTFARDFLGRDNLTDFHRDFFEAFGGPDPEAWDERYKLFSLCWGQGGGKGFAVEIVVSWTLYRLMLLVNPHRFFGLAEGSFIDILNISFVNHEQAQAVFFERVKQVIRLVTDPETGRNWFGDRGLDMRERGDLQETMIEFPRRVRCRCLSFTSSSFEGSDVALCLLDEVSRTVESPPRNVKAHRLLGKIIGNTTTRFGMKGKVVVLAYPEAEDSDLVVETFSQASTQFTSSGRRERTGEGIRKTWYGSRGATYEVNPRCKREDFEEERKADPEGVATRIDCNPPHSKTGFYRAFPDKVDASFSLSERRAVIKYEVVPITHTFQSNGKLEARTYTGVRLLWAEGDDEFRVLGGDPGERSDIFALALARTEPAKRPVEVMVVRREREIEGPPPGMSAARMTDPERRRNLQVEVVDHAVVIDGLVEIVPIRYQRIDPKSGRAQWDTHPISFASVRDFIVQLKGNFPNLVTAAFDRWESVELIEELLKSGIDAQALPFTAREQYALYSQHRSLVYNDLVACVPSPRAVREFRDLQEVRPGTKVDHKPDATGSKDMADAIVIACNLALECGIQSEGSYILR